jgi:hypothetical protein
MRDLIVQKLMLRAEFEKLLVYAGFLYKFKVMDTVI